MGLYKSGANNCYIVTLLLIFSLTDTVSCYEKSEYLLIKINAYSENRTAQKGFRITERRRVSCMRILLMFIIFTYVLVLRFATPDYRSRLSIYLRSIKNSVEVGIII